MSGGPALNQVVGLVNSFFIALPGVEPGVRIDRPTLRIVSRPVARGGLGGWPRN